MSVSPQDVVFAYDFSRIETVGGVRYLWDYGPNGFHFAFPGGAADPTPQLDGSLSFDGGDSLALPAASLARFYTQMPTGQWTAFVSTALITSAVGGSPRLFSCWNSTGGGVNKGFTIQINRPTETIIRGMFIIGHGAAGTDYIVGSVTPPTSMPGHCVACWTNETTPRGLHEQAANAFSWGAGAYGTTVYDAAIVPRIGMDPAGTNPLTGRGGMLALIRGALSSADLAFYSRLIAEGTKPWCVR